MALHPIICVVIVSSTMDDPISKLPKYVFRRANGSYRYKRNVPKALREVIPKATVYRQLGSGLHVKLEETWGSGQWNVINIMMSSTLFL